MTDLSWRFISLGGFVLIALLAWLTGGRGTPGWRTVRGSVLLAWGLGGLIFMFPGSRSVLEWVNNALLALIVASQKGAQFLFGPLALGPGQTLPDGTASVGFVLAFQVLPSVIFFSALVSALYYLNIMPRIVNFLAKGFYRFMRISGAEALSAGASIFVGIESGIAIRPFLEKMTRSELLTLLTCMMATVAGTVMGIYVLALKDAVPNIAGHLVSASLISIPCAVLIAKLYLPEDSVPETLGKVPDSTEDKTQANVVSALLEGGSQGVSMSLGIASALIIVLGLSAVADLVFGFFSANLSLAKVLGWLAWPFVVLMGLRPEEWEMGAQILGTRLIETEVVSYFQLAAMQTGETPVFSSRSAIILSYALCGFVHIASFGIFVGGLSALVPERIKDFSELGLKGLWTAFLATLATGCIAGVFV
ncbi:MAG: nucleoside permease nupX [Nitrospinae bacterium CG11_big_fil_rev_8_21_14_0_20_45_15]|nr:MAG: nucleoside permease nupX [Nitrospinae bacterium CG11_big_fil_rev_8_21_14_0_20_45_15]